MTSLYTVLSKDMCHGCTEAVEVLADRGLPHVVVKLTNLAELNSRLREMGRTQPVDSFPQCFRDGLYVGGLDNLRAALTEPLLQPNPDRFTPFPIQYHDMWAMYKKAVACFWTAEEIKLSRDRADWEKLSPGERHFISHVLAFFASSDGIVAENLSMRFCTEVQVPEARAFYANQGFVESIHSEVYGLLLDTYITDPEERLRLFRAIHTIPCVQKKADWALTYMDPGRSFAERLLAFVCVEGILFSGSFCAIFWLKKRNLLPGLAQSNDFIARDEGLHQQFGELLYGHLRTKLTAAEAHRIVGEAVASEIEFITDALPCRLIGMNADLMVDYIKFVADRILVGLGYDRLYGVQECPFDWMQNISMAGKKNFFEEEATEYKSAFVMQKDGDKTFGVDDDF